MSNQQAPKNWKMVKLGDLFTEEQLQHIFNVCMESNNLDECQKKLLPYFQSIKKQLESKGLLPEYASYAVPFWIKEARKEIFERNQDQQKKAT